MSDRRQTCDAGSHPSIFHRGHRDRNSQEMYKALMSITPVTKAPQRRFSQHHLTLSKMLID